MSANDKYQGVDARRRHSVARFVSSVVIVPSGREILPDVRNKAVTQKRKGGRVVANSTGAADVCLCALGCVAIGWGGLPAIHMLPKSCRPRPSPFPDVCERSVASSLIRLLLLSFRSWRSPNRNGRTTFGWLECVSPPGAFRRVFESSVCVIFEKSSGEEAKCVCVYAHGNIPRSMPPRVTHSI